MLNIDGVVSQSYLRRDMRVHIYMYACAHILKCIIEKRPCDFLNYVSYIHDNKSVALWFFYSQSPSLFPRISMQYSVFLMRARKFALSSDFYVKEAKRQLLTTQAYVAGRTYLWLATSILSSCTRSTYPSILCQHGVNMFAPADTPSAGTCNLWTNIDSTGDWGQSSCFQRHVVCE